MLVGGAHRALALSSLAKVAITASEADDAGVLHVFHFRRIQDCAPCIRHTLRCPGLSASRPCSLVVQKKLASALRNGIPREVAGGHKQWRLSLAAGCTDFSRAVSSCACDTCGWYLDACRERLAGAG